MSNNSIVEHRANYHFVALREEYLLVCQQCKYKKPDTPKSKNKASAHCKALILDILEHWTNTKRDRRESLAIYMTYKQWSDSMYGMFGRNVIIDSLDELIGEGLVIREPYKMYGKDTFQYYLNYQELNRRMKALPEKAPDKLLPQKDAFTNKRENDSTHLQVNGKAFTNKPVTRLQINEDAFTSNHNLDTTEIPNTNSAESTKGAATTSKGISILTPDQQNWFEKIYCYSKIGRIIPDYIDKTLQKHLTKLMQHIKTAKELDSLFEYVQKRLMETNLQDKTVYPGNLTNAKYLSGWLQEQERSHKEMSPYVRAVMQSAGQLTASTPGSQYIVDELEEVAQSYIDQHSTRQNNENAQEAYESFLEYGLIHGKLPEYWTQEHIEQVDTQKQISIRLLLEEWKKGQQLITTGPLAGQPRYDADPWL